MDLEFALEKIGLSKQEADVYLATLKLGVAKASQIAQKANAKREATYYTLSLLHEKGFISEVIKSGVKYYNAIQPKKILDILEEQKQQKATAIKEILPELESLQKISLTTPKVEFYEGMGGLKSATLKLIEKPDQEIYCYVPEKILHIIPLFSMIFRRKRKEKKVRLKVITEKKQLTLERKKFDKEELREMRFNDKLISNIDSAYYILPDSILILKANEKEQLGVYIKEPSTAKLQKKIFKEIWKQAKP